MKEKSIFHKVPKEVSIEDVLTVARRELQSEDILWAGEEDGKSLPRLDTEESEPFFIDDDREAIDQCYRSALAKRGTLNGERIVHVEIIGGHGFPTVDHIYFKKA